MRDYLDENVHFCRHKLKESNLKSDFRLYKEILEWIALQSSIIYRKFSDEKESSFYPIPGARSVSNTLDGIIKLIEIADVTDAFVLTRKLRDVLFLDLVILWDGHINGIDKIGGNITDTKVYKDEKKRVSEWLNGKVFKYGNRQDIRYYDYTNYKKIINKNDTIKLLFQTYFDDRDNEISKNLNDYVHINGFDKVDNIYIFQFKPDFCNELGRIIKTIMVEYISTLFIIKSSLFASSDYIDNLESEIEPENGSQFWVIPSITKFVNKIIKKEFKDVYRFIKNNQSEIMKI